MGQRDWEGKNSDGVEDQLLTTRHFHGLKNGTRHKTEEWGSERKGTEKFLKTKEQREQNSDGEWDRE